MAQDTPRDRLTREVDEITARIATMTTDLHAIFDASVDSNADDEHDPEGQTIGYERAQLTALITAARAQLTAVEQALTRLEEGSFGICTVCLRPIPAERLEVRPTATTCVEHAARRVDLTSRRGSSRSRTQAEP